MMGMVMMNMMIVQTMKVIIMAVLKYLPMKMVMANMMTESFL